MPNRHFPELQRALTLAHDALLIAPPNPRVGCLLVDAAGQVIGQGHTQRTGGPHAEIMALRDAAERGHDPRGATAYVTLEPCAHHGRTGPCCDALIAARVARVVAIHTDPNPQVAGQGFARLRAAGVDVEQLPADHPLAAQAHELNIGFFSRMVRRTPWVRMKMAASLDGTTALANGASQWITSPASRADGHAWRARACAVLTGVGTVLADDPQLDVRLVATPRQPALVVVDSRLRTPPDARLFQCERRLLIYTANRDAARVSALEARGATVIHLPDAQGRIDLAALLQDLAEREVNELHVEAGRQLNGALLRAGLVDELLLYLAPKLLGPGAGLADIGPLTTLAQGIALDWRSIERIGADLRILARLPRRDAF